jgi:hypothetical protein
MEAFEVEHEFPEIGLRVMSLDTREVRHRNADCPELLLVIEDITERRAAERRQQAILQEKELLLAETQHRINNSLQIIANILLLKARYMGFVGHRRWHWPSGTGRWRVV